MRMRVRYNHRRRKVLPVDVCQRDGIENAKRICAKISAPTSTGDDIVPRSFARQDYADSVDLRQGGSHRGERITHLPLVGFDFASMRRRSATSSCPATPQVNHP
jgi:hypothetical protein